jgi:DNA-binding NtrC family response regulator
MRAPSRSRAARKRFAGSSATTQALRALAVTLPSVIGPTFATDERMRAATRILIVDDEPNACTALTELLRDEGYEVASADGGPAAQARLADFHPDVVLADAKMPPLEGAPALVLMSARPPPYGSVTPFVDKPIDIDRLLRTVEHALRRR